MRLSRPDSEFIGDDQGPLGEVEYICIAADLLQQMFSELQAQAASNSLLARAMAGREWYAQDCLWTLHEIASLLAGVIDHPTAILLKQRAIALVGVLSDEFSDLTLGVVDE
jgi:hypothetical protein